MSFKKQISEHTFRLFADEIAKMKGNSKEPVACLLVGDDLIQRY